MIGGTWGVNCFLCGLPFSTQHDLPAPMEVDLEWLECGSGFDANRNAVVTVETDDGYGRFPIYGRPDQRFCIDEYYVAERDASRCTNVGIVCHEACHEFVEKTIGHAVSARAMTDMYRKSVHSRDYRGQFFKWEMAYDREGPAYFHSPMSAEGSSARDRIGRCLASYYTGEQRPIVTSHSPTKSVVRKSRRSRQTSHQAKSPRAGASGKSPRPTRPQKTKVRSTTALAR